MSEFHDNATLTNHQLKQERLVFEVKIVANATPASKTHYTDIPAVAFLRTEGLTAEVDALETVAFTTAADNATGDSVFGIFITDIADLDKVMKITVSEKTALSTALVVTKHGTDGKTTAGNIAFSIAAAGLTLATESPTIVVEVEFLKLV